MTDLSYRRLGVLALLISALISLSACIPTGMWCYGKVKAVMDRHSRQIEASYGE